MLLASIPKDFGLGPFIASEDFKKKNKKNLLAMGDSHSGRKKGTHPLNQRSVELGEEVDPSKMDVVVLCCREDIGDKVVTIDKPATVKDVLNVKDRIVFGIGGNRARERYRWSTASCSLTTMSSANSFAALASPAPVVTPTPPFGAGSSLLGSRHPCSPSLSPPKAPWAPPVPLPIDNVKDGSEYSVFDIQNIFCACWFINRDHLIANVLSATQDNEGCFT
jgi:hypothetical protein